MCSQQHIYVFKSPGSSCLPRWLLNWSAYLGRYLSTQPHTKEGKDQQTLFLIIASIPSAV